MIDEIVAQVDEGPRNGKCTPGDAGISVIIPFRNSDQTIERTLDCLVRQEVALPVELILVDDRSTDGTMDIVSRHPIQSAWRVKHIQNDAGGLATGYNLGWREAQYEYLVFIHSDCYVDDVDSLMKMATALQEKDAVAARAWIVLPKEDWNSMSFWDRVANSRYVGREALGLGGKFDGVRRSALEQVQGLDDDRFYSAGEDVDLKRKLLQIGRIIETDVRVVHRHLYPADSSLLFLFRKQVQLGQGFGAVISKYGRYTGRLPTLAIHMVKLALIVGVFIPVISPLSLLLLILLAASYSWRVFFTWDWRILLIIPVNIGLFVTFFYAAAVGIVTGRQKIYYK